MRKEVTNRFYRVFAGLPVDRVPDMEFGWWAQTIRRWLKEGLPLPMTPEEASNGDSPKLAKFFGLEDGDCGYTLSPHCGMNPTFEEKVLSQRGDVVVIQQAGGIVAERYTADSDNSSIPRFISFPVKTPADWQEIQQRYRLDDPARQPQPERVAAARAAAAAGQMIQVSVPGFYWLMRNWLGTENLSLAFYDYPDMVHDMVDRLASMATQGIERLPADIPIDIVQWDEDLAFKNKPLIGPAQFREFLQPGYRRVMAAARRRGCELSRVDSDGDPHAIVPMWLEEGVNIVHPMEVAAGTDGWAWRREFGKKLRFSGHIDKRALAAGDAAIAAELERVRPLLEDGGYIPHVDHRVPPDVPYRNYCVYLEKKRKLIGK